MVLVGDVTATPPIISISSASTTSMQLILAAQWWVVVDQLHSSSVVDPFASARLRRTPPQFPATCPQPPGLGAHRGREISFAINVDAAKQSDVARLQLTLGQQSRRNGLSRHRQTARPSPQRRMPCHRRSPAAECLVVVAASLSSDQRPAGRAFGQGGRRASRGSSPTSARRCLLAVTSTCSTSGTGLTRMPRVGAYTLGNAIHAVDVGLTELPAMGVDGQAAGGRQAACHLFRQRRWR